MTSAVASDTPQIIQSTVGRCRHLQLNDPSTLNAFDEHIAHAFQDAVHTAAQDDDVDYIVVTSTSPKSFCSGGNVRRMSELFASGDTSTAEYFFATEYNLCADLTELKKPYITLVDGYCIGGGLGISANGQFMVVTERALMCMPEVSLGFCTDAGMSWVLPRLWGRGGEADINLGRYLALTGAWLTGDDAVWCGLAGYLVESAQLPELTERILHLDYESGQVKHAIAECLGTYARRPLNSQLPHIIAEIEETFSAPSVEQICGRLQQGIAAGRLGEWARDALTALEQSSPTALEGTYLIINWGNESPDVRCAIHRELRMGAQYLCQRPDFQHGVRAKLIDKRPFHHWEPATFDEVDREALYARRDQ